MFGAWTFGGGVTPIGIDVSPGSARLLQLKQGSKGAVVIGAARIDEGHAPDWSGEERARFVESLRRAMLSGRFQGRRCVIGIGDELTRVRSVRQPKMPREEAARAVAIEAADRLGFESDQASCVDWLHAGEVRQGEDVRDELILVGAERETLTDLVDAVCEAGLEPLAVDVGFLACARAMGLTLRRTADKERVRVVIDVRPSGSGVLVTRGSDAVFYKPVEIGGLSFNEAASKQLEMDASAVADLRLRRLTGRDRERDPRIDRAIFEAVRPQMAELASEAALCVRYYSVTFFGHKPDEAIVVGTEATEPRLVETLGEALSIPTSIGRPLEGVDTSKISSDADRRGPLAEWTSALGLALRTQVKPGDAALLRLLSFGREAA